MNLIMDQWDLLVTSMNKLTSTMKAFKVAEMQDFEDVDVKVLGLDARVGQKPSELDRFDDCAMVWDGLTFLHGSMQELMASHSQIKQMVATFSPQAVETIMGEIAKAQVKALAW